MVGIVGDGAFRMTAMELATATAQELGLVVFVFNDGELAQIAQAQEIPYNRKTCTVLGPLDVAGVAQATGAKFLRIGSDGEIDAVIRDALAYASRERKPVLVDVVVLFSESLGEPGSGAESYIDMVRTNAQRIAGALG